jgi:hypothetical protein
MITKFSLLGEVCDFVVNHMKNTAQRRLRLRRKLKVVSDYHIFESKSGDFD